MTRTHFSPTACAGRLGRLRGVLDEVGASALLLIAGIDSRRHQLSARVLRWLLLGASGPGEEGACAPDEVIDEVVLLVTPTGVKLYCTLACWRILMPVVSLWRNLEVRSARGGLRANASGCGKVSCLPCADLPLSPRARARALPNWSAQPTAQLFCLHEPAAYEDADVVEAHKIDSFVRMLAGLAPAASAAAQGGALPRVAVPFDTEAEAKVVETWPLVQAYALDDARGAGFGDGPAPAARGGVGGRNSAGNGFFSMRHRVVPAGAELRGRALALLDATSLRCLHAHGLARFAKQFGAVAAILDRAADGETRRRLTERQLAEPLATYFEHGRLRAAPPPPASGAGADAAAEAEAAAAALGPRVLFGPRIALGAHAPAGGAARAAADRAGAARAQAVPAEARPSLQTFGKASEASGSGEPTHFSLELADSLGTPFSVSDFCSFLFLFICVCV